MTALGPQDVRVTAELFTESCILYQHRSNHFVRWDSLNGHLPRVSKL